MRRLALVLPAAAVAALAVSCGGGGGGGKTVAIGTDTTSAPPPATVTDTVVPPATTTTASTTTSSTAPSGPAPCATTSLKVSLGLGNGAAGSVIYPLHFTNSGSASCTITGFPGVSFVAPGNGQQVGKPAVRSSSSTPTVTLTEGAQATASVKVAGYQNFPPAQCKPTAVSGLRVYPPDNKAATYVAFTSSMQACSAGETLLQIQPVHAGSGS